MKSDRIEAQSAAHAASVLSGRGDQVLQISEASGEAAVVRKAPVGKKPSIDEVATTIRQLSILVRSGIPLVEVLNGLAEQAKTPSLGTALGDMSALVSQGGSLSEAFGQYGSIFPKLSIEMAKVAEAGGSLPDSMSRLADHVESGAELMRKVKAALAYPIVIICISILTVIIMVTFILPRFMSLFDKMGAELPWTTKMLMDISYALTHQWYFFIAGAAALFFGSKKYANSPAGRAKIDAVVLKLPVVGEIVQKIILSRVIASMATLLSSGVPMVQTLEISAAAANNEVVRSALLKSSRDVAEGNATSQSLKANAIFPPLVLQMVASGEKTGELPMMLDYICSLYSRETDAKVKSLTSIIEPIMIVVLGIIVGFIAMSVIVPIYSLVGGVK